MLSQEAANEQSGDQAWLVTFADLISLLLAFFVMVFAMSTVEGERWQAVVSSLSRWFTPFEQSNQPRPTKDKSIETINPTRATQLDYLASVLEDSLGANRLIAGGGVQRLDDRLVISILCNTLFNGESIVPEPSAKVELGRIGETLSNVNNAILVVGHASPGPHAGEKDYSGWATSLARAAAVAKELRRAGYDRDIPIFGSNAMRIEYLSPEFVGGERRAWIDRVDIVIRDSKAL